MLATLPRGRRARRRAVRIASPDAASIVARIEGIGPGRPVAVPDGPHRCRSRSAPTGGRTIRSAASSIRNADGVDEVWGRGAIDMLNLTSSMAVAFRHLATTGFRPKGDLIYFGVADEEAGGVVGRRVDVRAPPGGDRRRLLPHRARRLVHRSTTTAIGTSPSTSARRASPGVACGSPAPRATDRCRSAPTTRSSRRPRSSADSSEYRTSPHISDAWRRRSSTRCR